MGIFLWNKKQWSWNVFPKYALILAMSTSLPILSADFPHVIAAGHVEDFQIYIFEWPSHL